MKIHFCDLCNESVPQGELDAGRAFMRKGRVVCGKCDSLMTQREEAAAVAATSAGFGSMGTAASGAPVTPVVSGAPGAPGATPPPGEGPLTPFFTGATPGAGGHAPAAHHHSHHSMRSRGSGGGVAVGLVAIGLTACASYWLLERSDKVASDVSARLTRIESEQRAADQRAMERSTEQRGEILGLQERLEKQLEIQHRALEAKLEEAQSKHSSAVTAVDDLRRMLAELKVLEPSVQRHEQELGASALRFAQIERRANELETALGGLGQKLEEGLKASPTVPEVAPTPPGAPPWMGLVQQLESVNSGDRWVAVQSLGETRDPAVSEYILPRLKDVDIFVRMVTARVLGELGSSKSVGALIEALGDNDAAVREAAYVALCAVTKKSLPFDPHQDASERAKKVKAWQEWWKKSQEEGMGQ
jgi:HEAT repeat protein